MRNALNAQQSHRTSDVHRARRGTGATARVHQKNTEDSPRRSRPRAATPSGVEAAGLNPAHLGSSLDDFLKEEGLFETVQALAVKKLFALKLAELMKKEKLTKDALAKRMKTSRTALDRLLDPTNPSVTLVTLGKAACALGHTLRVELADVAR